MKQMDWEPTTVNDTFGLDEEAYYNDSPIENGDDQEPGTVSPERNFDHSLDSQPGNVDFPSGTVEPYVNDQDIVQGTQHGPTQNLPSPAHNIMNDHADPPQAAESDKIAGAYRPSRLRKKPQCLILSHHGKAYQSTAATQIQGVDLPQIVHPDHHLDQQYALVSHYIMTQLSMKAGLKC